MDIYTNTPATYKDRIDAAKAADLRDMAKDAAKEAETPLSMSDLRRYIKDHPSLVRVSDLWNRRKLPLEWEYSGESEANLYLCDATKAKSAKYGGGAFHRVYKYVVQTCVTPGFENVVRVLFYGGFSLNYLYKMGEKAYDGKKPLRVLITTKPAWNEIEKNTGFYDNMTAAHKATEIERLYQKSGECWVNQSTFYHD